MEEWDDRYREAPHQNAEPAEIVTELSPLLPRGQALDLACGTGRHALLLTKLGYTTTGVDASSMALDIAEERARVAGIQARRISRLTRANPGSTPSLHLAHADLEQVNLPEASFEVILCIHYLQRSLFQRMELALRPGGMLVFETFTRAQLEFGSGPRNPEFLLESNELRTAFPALRTIFYRELRAGKGIASLLARKT